MDGDDPEWLRPRGARWRVEGRTHLHDNPWFALEAYDTVAPTGRPAPYYVQRYKNIAVGVLPLHEDGTVTLVGQWRFPFDAYSWELPEGGVPEGEAPVDGAKRELREEAGLAAAHWRDILTMQLSNASSDEVAYGFLATGLTPVERDPDETEDLAIARVPFAEALQAATSGRIQDSITVAVLLRAYHMAHVGELSRDLTRLILG